MPSLNTGPSTTQGPYLIDLEPNVRLTSILSAGDAVGFKPDGVTPWRMVGIPDGLGAFDNGDGSITVLMNHEIGNTSGVVREHGSIGSFVSALTIDKATLAVTHAGDLGKTIYLDSDGDGVYTLSTTDINRLCSADLAPVSAFYDAASGLGTQERIFLTGEESGAEGRGFAFVATGADKGSVYELPGLGNFSFENSAANGYTGVKTVVISQDDSTPGQLYVYVGDKQASGTDVQKAGLVGGVLYGIKATGIGNTLTADAENQLTPATTPTSGSFTVAEITNAATQTGAQIETASDAAGISEWWRPEDGAWDTLDHNRYYFVTTSSQTAPSRLWALDFADAADPTLGGSFTMLLDGTEGQVMFDNLTVDANGHVLLQEDPGGFAPAAKLWIYDPANDSLNLLAKFDPARFGDSVAGVITPPTPPFNIDEESSGIIDVSGLLGDANTQVFLLDAQAHYEFGAPGSADRTEIVQGGQLMALYVDAVRNGDRLANTLNGGYTDDSISGGRGDDVIRGGSGNDTIHGNIGNDVIDGGSGNDVLNGNSGDDVILGGSGNDVLNGMAGNDTLIGGLGADTLTGHGGFDIFRYGAAVEGGDEIIGFRTKQDDIEVSAGGFGGGLVNGMALTAGQFVTGTAANAANGQFLFDAASGNLSWDADGTGAGAASLIAHLAGGVVTAADILVIA